MKVSDVQAGSTIMNDECAFRATTRGETGWIGIYISLVEGGLLMTGHDCLLPDDQIEHYRPVPWEWTPIGNGSEERYAWSEDWRRLVREVRPAVQPTVDGIRGHRILTLEEHQTAVDIAMSTPLITEEQMRGFLSR